MIGNGLVFFQYACKIVKYDIIISPGSNVMVKIKVDNRQTDRRTDGTQQLTLDAYIIIYGRCILSSGTAV